TFQCAYESSHGLPAPDDCNTAYSAQSGASCQLHNKRRQGLKTKDPAAAGSSVVIERRSSILVPVSPVLGTTPVLLTLLPPVLAAMALIGIPVLAARAAVPLAGVAVLVVLAAHLLMRLITVLLASDRTLLLYGVRVALAVVIALVHGQG